MKLQAHTPLPITIGSGVPASEKNRSQDTGYNNTFTVVPANLIQLSNVIESAKGDDGFSTKTFT